MRRVRKNSSNFLRLLPVMVLPSDQTMANWTRPCSQKNIYKHRPTSTVKGQALTAGKSVDPFCTITKKRLEYGKHEDCEVYGEAMILENIVSGRALIGSL